jgi:hypothetical protein
MIVERETDKRNLIKIVRKVHFQFFIHNKFVDGYMKIGPGLSLSLSLFSIALVVLISCYPELSLTYNFVAVTCALASVLFGLQSSLNIRRQQVSSQRLEQEYHNLLVGLICNCLSVDEGYDKYVQLSEMTRVVEGNEEHI